MVLLGKNTTKKRSPLFSLTIERYVFSDKHVLHCFLKFMYGPNVNESTEICLRCDFSNVVATLHTTKQVALQLSSVVFFVWSR